MQRQQRCSCGSMIWKLTTPGGAAMPVDVGQDPDGVLLGVILPGGDRGVRVLSEAERASPPPGPRFSPHWQTCPQADQYRRQARRQAPDTWPRRGEPTPRRAGPCVRCGGVNPHRYGPGPASTLCPACREKVNLPPVP